MLDFAWSNRPPLFVCGPLLCSTPCPLRSSTEFDCHRAWMLKTCLLLEDYMTQLSGSVATSI